MPLSLQLVDGLVIAGAILAIALVLWYFLGAPRGTRR
jgi:hypothetical protein